LLLVLSFNLFNELFKPFSLKRAAKIRTFSLPPNFFDIFFDFFESHATFAIEIMPEHSIKSSKTA
jgi:hypothetical protein